MFYFSFLLIIICIFMSIRTLFLPNSIKGKNVSIENFLYLSFIYFTVMFGFGLIYVLLDTQHILVLDTDTLNNQMSFLQKLETTIYFSAITLFSVGFGDIAPIGVGRIIAVFEALIGYTIPAAFVYQAVNNYKKIDE